MIEIQTVSTGENKGTVSVLLVGGIVCCWCLELPWRDNERNISCIPPGEYKVKLEYSSKYKMKLYELKNVPGRSEIKIHIGNYLKDTKGCFLVGSIINMNQGYQYSVGSSGPAFDKFMAMMGDRKEDTLIISGR